MTYQLDENLMLETFIKKGKFYHQPEGKFKLFPFVGNNNALQISELDSVVGEYLRVMLEREQQDLTPDLLVNLLLKTIVVEDENSNDFRAVVTKLFFDSSKGNGIEKVVRPINLEMMAHIPCQDSSEKKMANYLVDVLGSRSMIETTLKEALNTIREKGNVLERLVLLELETKDKKVQSGVDYYRIVNLADPFTQDLIYVLKNGSRTKEYLIELLDYYYFFYTSQVCFQLNRFLMGSRDQIEPLYFSLEWEKTSKSRKCFTEGWRILEKQSSTMFYHAIVLNILNQNPTGERFDYIALQELIDSNSEQDAIIADQIAPLTKVYRTAITDCRAMEEIEKDNDENGATIAEIEFLYNSVKTQFENTGRGKVSKDYSKKFEKFCRKYLKYRGSSGLMLNISEEFLIFLTKLCIKDHEQMRLNDVFKQMELRGVFLDNTSKEHVMHYYEKLNLIEKKSDSGDAQYVKRIL